MARCDNGDCRTFDATKASWFKVAEMGMINDGMVWATDLLRSNRGRVSVDIPASLKEGVYLLRHEVISLRNQDSEDTKVLPRPLAGQRLNPVVVLSSLYTVGGSWRWRARACWCEHPWCLLKGRSWNKASSSRLDSL